MAKPIWSAYFDMHMHQLTLFFSFHQFTLNVEAMIFSNSEERIHVLPSAACCYCTVSCNIFIGSLSCICLVLNCQGPCYDV